jgi:FAD/FMN-containing dehydrogenase
MPFSADSIAAFRSIVGPDGILESPSDIEPFLVDHRRLYRGATPCVLRPSSTDQVSQILQHCHGRRIGVVPIGGNTSYCGGATPSSDGTQVMVSLGRMRKVRALDPLNYTMTLEAGCVLAQAQEAAASVDRLFPLSLGSEGSCQIGGNLSTNAGGTAVLRYGMMRDLILGLEVVLPDGRVLESLSGLRKDNTGYDLRDLFIGAEGTLGIITAATCKLFSRPAFVTTAFIAVPNPQAAVRLLSRLRSATSDAVTTFELIPRIGLDLVLKHISNVRDPLDESHDWYVLLEIGTGKLAGDLREQVQDELAAAMDAGEVATAVIAESEAQREMLWRIRETIPEGQRQDGPSIKHDVSVTTTELPRFIEEAGEIVHSIIPAGRIVSYGHLGDGNLHFNVSPPAGYTGSSAQFMQLAEPINRAVHDLIARYGGSISAEHGIGQLKRDELARYKNRVALALMRSIKIALDPHAIMNPGKVL